MINLSNKSLQPNKRRQKIIKILKSNQEPYTGSDLADKFGVTRQVIVQDIALIRAEGIDIISTSRGYLLQENKSPFLKATIPCRHRDDLVKDELMIMIEHGARVLDVRVEHPLYGELKGNLMLTNRKEVEEFLERVENNDAGLLAELTDGIHLHTVEIANNEVLKNLKTALSVEGYLLEG